MRNRLRRPVVNPNTVPKIRNTSRVPNFKSIQYPINDGTTISNATVVIRDDHSRPRASDERSSRCCLTVDRLGFGVELVR